MHRVLAAILLAAALVLTVSSAATAAPVPAGAEYSEVYFDTPAGYKLHADVFKPKGLPADAKIPVILTVSPYTNHSGSTVLDPPDFEGTGPNPRFFDLVTGAKLMERGYAYIVVDLPGFGGSGGCTDWGGPAEQLASKHAVEWAAALPWSNGKVGMYGKSYDGWTGLMAIAQQPKGLAAVVAQEPVYSGYRYLYSDGIRFAQAATMGPVFGGTNLMPGTTSDSVDYQVNSAPVTPHCVALNAGQHHQDNPSNGFWTVRDLIPALKGLRTPLFLTQGFLENNTKPDGAFDVLAGMEGPKRAWFGEFDHVRGNDVCDGSPGQPGYCAGGNRGKLMMGRAGWFDEVVRFYDEHLKGMAPAVADPAVVLQDGSGRWRSEQSWPPTDSRRLVTELESGTYTDDGGNNGTGTSAGDGIWSISAPLSHDVHLSGEANVSLEANALLPNANLVVDVYSIDPAGKATLITRGGRVIRSSGLQTLTLYGNDWPIPAGNRIGVLITGSNAEWYVHVPTNQAVTVESARIALPFLATRPAYDLTGTPALKLQQYRATAPFPVPAAALAAPPTEFSVPGPLQAAG